MVIDQQDALFYHIILSIMEIPIEPLSIFESGMSEKDKITCAKVVKSPSTKVKMSPMKGTRKVDTLLNMSAKELSRLEVMQKLADKRMSQKEAARILGRSVRQVKRLLKTYRREGAAGLISKRRGQPSHNRLAEEVKQQAFDLLKSKYCGFRPTLAHEKLVELEGLKISDESVRQLMIAESLWKPKKNGVLVTHPLRERRACFGELVQIDGSPHDWFEGRAPACTLLVFIDDATGRLVQLLFVESESFFSYAQAAEGYFTCYGKPEAFYSDKHGIFRVNQPSAGTSNTLTQFGRAMQELDIQIICANTPQAKGRVERANQTLQDRLPKEMRLRGISSWNAGNAYLPEFMADFNGRFAVPPRSTLDAHRPLTAQDDLPQILTWQEPRVLSNNLTLHFQKVVYQIQTDRPTYAMRRAAVTVRLNAQGNITILYKNQPLNYTIFHEQSKQSEIVQPKQLDLALQKIHPPHKPAPDHPWRKGFATPLSQSRDVPPRGDISTLENR
jgi:transposase